MARNESGRRLPNGSEVEDKALDRSLAGDRFGVGHRFRFGARPVDFDALSAPNHCQSDEDLWDTAGIV
jgi:hypothetical protein